MADIFADLGDAVRDHGAVARVRAAAESVLHRFEAGEVGGQVLEDGRAVAQHVVAGEHGAFFVEDQRRVVGGVAGAVEGSEGGSLRLENLLMLDG